MVVLLHHRKRGCRPSRRHTTPPLCRGGVGDDERGGVVGKGEIVEKVLKKVGEGRAVCVEKWGSGRKKMC